MTVSAIGRLVSTDLVDLVPKGLAITPGGAV